MQANFNNITAAGVSYDLPETPPCHLHWKDPNGHWNFWCPVTGAATGTSSSPRTELRETEADTSTSFNWSPAEFLSSRLEGVAVVKMSPSSEKVIFAQVHGKDAKGPFVKLLQKGKELTAEVRFRPGDSASPTVIRMPVGFGEARASYSIEVTGDMECQIILNGQRFECPVDPEWAAHPFYFKAGAYVIDNEGPDTEGGWVIYENLAVFHE